MLKTSLILGACCLAFAPYSIARADNTARLDTAAIEAATGLKGTLNKKENVFKVSKPRTDVPTSIAAWKIPPFMGLTSWAAFTPAHDGMTMMMGDTVLFEDEVNPVMSVALDNGLDVTALHNHFFFDQPKVYFMHIGGTGDAAAFAAAVKKVYGKVAEIRTAHPEPQNDFEGGHIGSPNHISGAPLEKILGYHGQAKDGMFKVVIGRTAAMHDTSIGNEMGVNTWAAFAGTDDQAVVDGDFAMKESELQTVLKSMRHQGINVVAIHQHMSMEQPRILFLHYWGLGKAGELARSLESVLQAQSTAAK
ncbi:MAG TPA: DUF1259 domain-containing protein [Hyphomicrobium sp.]|jgi:hypothetical protein|nr:DUF1259 domain-containing protein [Hyphomicrobium sp.]